METKESHVIGAVLIFLSVSSFSGCLDSKDEDEGSDEFNKEGALEFSLKVVRTYFENDIEEFISYLDDELYSLEGDGPYSISDVRGFIEEEGYVIDEEYTTYTFEDYIGAYSPYIMDNEEAESEYPGFTEQMEQIGWEFDGNDYLFIGYETISGDEGFLWDDPLVFGITSEDGKWEFKAFGS